MSTALVEFQDKNAPMQIAPEFLPVVQGGLTDDLSAGVGGGFAVVSIRAGKFRIKHRGEEIPVTDERGPVASIDAVILRANGHITKQFYLKSYDEGDSAAPDCFSLDGVVPSPGSPSVQAKTCAACPKNIFGSAPARNGQPSKGKACQDNRKLAIVPLEDLDNETFGGPMLFRVPPSALNDLAQFGQAWKARGYPYNAIGVRIGMDINASFPKPTFTAIRPLTSDEAVKVLEMSHSPAVEKILNDFDPAGTQPSAEPPVSTVEFIQPPAAAPAPAPAPAPAAAPAAPAAAKGTTFGKKPAAPPTAAPAAAAKPAGATFGKKAAKPAAPPTAAAAPAPAASEPIEGEATSAETVGDDPTANADIEQILAELGSAAG